VSSPSTSPEHSFYYVNENGERYDSSVSKASTGDLSIAREIFSDFIKASRLLGRDEELAKRIEKKLESLYPFRCTDDGALAEWSENFEPNELGHRHFSHLIGVYPANVINDNTPEMYEAAKLALFKRLDNGSGETGWSAAWALILLSKFGATERVGEYIRKLLIDSSAPNLLGYAYIADRPVHDIFQIDGNFGAVAAFAELFLHSDGDIIDILPCVPVEMEQGAVRGLRARGAVSVDVEWCDGKLSYVQITPDFDGEYTVRYNGMKKTTYAYAGESVKLFAKDQ
jgi:alpha-L-fucosidase 2